MNLKVLFVLILTCSVAWAQQQDVSSSSPISSSEQPVVVDTASSAQPQPAAQDSSSSSAPAQEPSPSEPPQAESTAAPPAQNPSSPPAVPPPKEDQGAQRGVDVTTKVPPAGIVTEPTNPPPTTPTTTPTTTTEPTVPTTPAPTPIEPPPSFPKNTGSWSIKADDKQGPCLRVDAAMQIHVKGNSSRNVSELVVDVPTSKEANVKLGGTCDPEHQKLSISWYSKRNETTVKLFYNKLSLSFSKQVEGNYALLKAQYEYNVKDEPTEDATVEGSFFVTSLKRSYRCHSEQRIETDAGSLILLTTDLQFEAFRDDTVNSTVFSAADECKADHRTSTAVVVGIGFGIGLLIVVCIALGIYLFKRFRSREGYQPLDSQN